MMRSEEFLSFKNCACTSTFHILRIQQLAYQRRPLPLAAARPGPAQGRAAAASGGLAEPRPQGLTQ